MNENQDETPCSKVDKIQDEAWLLEAVAIEDEAGCDIEAGSCDPLD